MSIPKDLTELLKAEVITPETAERLQQYYTNKDNSSTNRLFIAFGILGAILVGLGIILIIAHNWDELSRLTKTALSFLPLFIGQILCGLSITKKYDSVAWRESASAFLFFSVGACISLISQIYHIPGNMSSFLLTWMLLCLPMIYVMQSSITSLLYLIGITAYACETSYWSFPAQESYLYWLLLLMALPHYYLLLKKQPKSNFAIFHNWIVPLSVIISLGTVAKDTDELMFIAYFNLMGLLYLVGNMGFLARSKAIENSYKILGSFGTILLLLILSFKWFWEDLREKSFQVDELIIAPEFVASAISLLLAGGLFYFLHKKKVLEKTNPLAPVFILFIVAFFIGLSSSVSVILVNLYVFSIGILTIREGAKQDHLGILNFGLLVITALAACRFFDTDLSFVFRGIMFMSVGLGFFVANYWMLKRRKTNE